MPHILIVEPDCLLAKNLSGLFGRAGHSVARTADAQAAITLADARLPDVIILELLLAGRSGIEFLYEFRSYPEWQNVPAIIYTSLPQQEVALGSRCFAELSIGKFFHKPATSLQDLAAEVARLAQPVSA